MLGATAHGIDRRFWAHSAEAIDFEALRGRAVGVVGALAGVIGSMMALEAIKLITGAGQPLAGRLLVYDGLNGRSRTARVATDPTCPTCGRDE